MPPKLRTIIESPRYSDEISQIGDDIRRMDEILGGVTFTIARTPQVGAETDRDGVRAIRAFAFGGTQLLIYYAFDEETVELLSVVATPREDD